MPEETAETLINLSCDESRGVGFMESKIGSLNTSQPKLMSQAYQFPGRAKGTGSSVLSRFSSAPEKLAQPHKATQQSAGFLRIKPLFKIVMPKGESPSSASIDFESDFLDDGVKPHRNPQPAYTLVKPNLTPGGLDRPAIKLIESSPGRSLMLARGKFKSLNSPGFHLMRSIQKEDTESLNKTDNLSIDRDLKKQQSNNVLRKSSDVSIRSQRSILKQSGTKDGAVKPSRYFSIKEFEDAKKSVRGTPFSEFPQFGSCKKVSFSKTNMLKLYSIDKKMAPLPPR